MVYYVYIYVCSVCVYIHTQNSMIYLSQNAFSPTYQLGRHVTKILIICKMRVIISTSQGCCNS